MTDLTHEIACEEQDENESCICLSIMEAKYDAVIDTQLEDLALALL